MLFNSIDFAVFLPIVFIMYWFLTNHNLKLQNILIVIASYFFYGWWDWRFLMLIVFSTIIDYTIGYLLLNEEKDRTRKLYLWISIIVNIGFLGFFKYYNFFLDNFVSAFHFFGQKFSVQSLNIILPVGISFYTFQTLSYSIDVYKRKLQPTKDFIAFSAFVCFFPQLVAGPIERATNLLPQFFKKRYFNYGLAVIGMRQILWGLFKKVVIADNCAEYVNLIFESPQSHSGSTLLLGAVFFSFQIYGDFSGYSDIAIGTSRLFGFNLMQNFAYPYFSRDIAEFWRRWHISLSTWFRDYLYIPLGGSRVSKLKQIRNVFIIFIVSGFWHGANWTFIFWGLLNALFILPSFLLKTNRNNLEIVANGSLLPSYKDVIKMLITFMLATFAWIFFRADDLHHAFIYISHMFSESIFVSLSKRPGVWIIIFLPFFLTIEWLGREKDFAIQKISFKNNRIMRMAFYIFLVLIILLSFGKEQEFIYFQF